MAVSYRLFLLFAVFFASSFTAASRGRSRPTWEAAGRAAEGALFKRWNMEMGGCRCDHFYAECWNERMCQKKHGPGSTCTKDCCGTRCTGGANRSGNT